MRNRQGTTRQRVLWGMGIVGATLLWSLVAVAQELDTAQIIVTPPTPAPHDTIVIKLAGLWRDGCVPRDPQVSIVEHDIHIATLNPGEICTQALTPWELTVSIGQLSPATYTMRVTHNCPFGCPREIGHDTFTVVSSAFK